LVVVESIDVNDSSGTKGRVALLKNMVAAGFVVTALHFTQNDIQLDGITTVSVPEGKSGYYFLSRLQRYCYKWFRINIGDWYEKRSGFSFNWKAAVQAFAKALKRYHPEDFDMIWTMGKGTQFRPHAAVLSLQQWHKKWYAYVHDPYPQHLYPRPYNFVEHGYKKKRYFFMAITEKAKLMVFPSQLLKDWMQSYFGLIEGKEMIVPHQIQEALETSATLPDYFLKDQFTILHAGNLLSLRDPKPLVEAYLLFLERCTEAREHSQLLFIGKKSSFDSYLQQVTKNNTSIFCSDGYVPFEHVYVMQKHAIVNVILEAKSEISPFLPGKFAHCVAADNPIFLIGPYYSECKRLLGTDYPFSFEFSKVSKIADALCEIYKQWKVAKKDVTLNRPDLEHYLSQGYLKEILETSLH